MSDDFVLSKTHRLIVRIIQIVLIAGILSVVWFGRGNMNMFDSDELQESHE